MTKKDKENIEYIVKTLREYSNDMSEEMDAREPNDSAYGVALHAMIGMKIAYNMLLSAMQFGDLDWQAHEITIPSNSRFIKDGKLI